MSDSVEIVDTVTVVQSSEKGKKEKKGGRPKGEKKPKAAPTHPPVSEMVFNAIQTLKEKGGSSLIAIKKFITGTYKVDIEKLAPHIKKYLKTASETGVILHAGDTKGVVGKFILPPPATKKDKPIKAAKDVERKVIPKRKKPKPEVKKPVVAEKPKPKTPSRPAPKSRKPASPAPKSKKSAPRSKNSVRAKKSSPAKKSSQKPAAGKRSSRK